MSLFNENVVTLAKIEGTYGVDAAPTGVDALVTSKVKMTPLEMKTVSRELDKSGSGSDLELVADYNCMIEFDVELVGSGTLGTAPAFGKLLKACRCQETVVAVTSVAYRPYRAGTTALTFYFNIDGNRHKLLGSRGSFKIKADSQGIPYLSFTFWGLYVAPDASALPTGLTGWDAFQIPTVVNYENTSTFTLHGYSGVYKSFSFDAGNKVVQFNNPGEREVAVVEHKAKGAITILTPAIGTKDYFAIAKANTLGTMKIVHGATSTTKAIFEAAASTVQLLKPTYGDDEGRSTLSMDLNFVPTSAQNDEWELRFAAA